jgi:hypothetical protein
MSTSAGSLLPDSLAAMLRGDVTTFGELGLDAAQLMALCSEQGLTGLLHERLVVQAEMEGWPTGVREPLAELARHDAATELLRRQEIASTLSALASSGVHPILLKGTALAYSVYNRPSSRPRGDTDLMIRREDVDAVRQSMGARGYVPTLYCDGEFLFCQFEMSRQDSWGVHHAFDFHWKISTQSQFADLLSYDELAAQAMAVPALGPAARAHGTLHALLLTLVHPAMHHRNERRALWAYDARVLLSRLQLSEFDDLVELALARGVAAIVASELEYASALWGASIPSRVLERLHRLRTLEPSAAYLSPGRQWRHEFASNLRGLPSWSSRFRLIREVLFPSPEYMRRSFAPSGSANTAILPALYALRLIRGGRMMLLGRK